MRKFLLSLLFITQAFGCLCIGDIKAGFGQSSEFIASVINQASNEIENNLIPQINKNTQDIQNQNLELEKLLKAYKEELAEKKEMLFLLDKIEKLLK